ncbi:MAG: pilin [bacterium]|nr:pilin [bacterium]
MKRIFVLLLFGLVLSGAYPVALVEARDEFVESGFLIAEKPKVPPAQPAADPAVDAPESNVPTTLNPYTGTLAKPAGGENIFDSSLYSWRGITNIILPRVANWITGLLAGLAVLFLIITGVQYLLAGGEEDKLTKAHKSLIYILGALVLILFAYTLVYLTLSLLAP